MVMADYLFSVFHIQEICCQLCTGCHVCVCWCVSVYSTYINYLSGHHLEKMFLFTVVKLL